MELNYKIRKITDERELNYYLFRVEIMKLKF